MKQNIHQNHTRHIDAKLYSANYYDFMLFKGDVYKQNNKDLNNICIADFSKLTIKDGILYSDNTWSGATNSGVELNNIGLTGVDNGFIAFRKDRVTNEEFLNLYLKSQFKIESGDTRLFLTPVTGNTQMYSYPMSLIETEDEKYIALKGGFYQGFFKLEGNDYQVLPNEMKNDWGLHFELRPRSDYETNINTVNHTHPNNEGMFFYLGTRAENKFWPFYNTDKETLKTLKKVNAQIEGYFAGCGENGEVYDITENNVVNLENDWLKDEPKTIKEEGYFNIDDGYFTFQYSDENSVLRPNTSVIIADRNYFSDDYFESIYVNPISGNTKPGIDKKSKQLINVNQGYFNDSDTTLNTYDYNPNSVCWSTNDTTNKSFKDLKDPCCNEYFNDSYYDNKCPENDNKVFDEDYIGKGVIIDTEKLTDSEGHGHNQRGYIEIESDNKFLLFDRTPSGFTVETWTEGNKVKLVGRRNWPNANYFLLMNRTKTGYTKNTIESYNETHHYDFNPYKDIRNNTFGLRITKEGAIGYKYGVIDCENENRYSIIEEYSKPNLVKNNEWNNIDVRFCLSSSSQMRILIYVNGNLVLVSKEVDSFNFKKLDEVNEKQEGVPYNISLGGGSLGLLETIVPNYYAVSNYILPIERDYCGTFLGDIKSFKMYGDFISYQAIKQD